MRNCCQRHLDSRSSQAMTEVSCCGGFPVLAPPLLLRLPAGAALGQDALQQDAGGFVLAALGAGQLRLGGDQAALAGVLEDAGPVAPAGWPAPAAAPPPRRPACGRTASRSPPRCGAARGGAGGGWGQVGFSLAAGTRSWPCELPVVPARFALQPLFSRNRIILGSRKKYRESPTSESPLPENMEVSVETINRGRWLSPSCDGVKSGMNLPVFHRHGVILSNSRPRHPPAEGPGWRVPLAPTFACMAACLACASIQPVRASYSRPSAGHESTAKSVPPSIVLEDAPRKERGLTHGRRMASPMRLSQWRRRCQPGGAGGAGSNGS